MSKFTLFKEVTAQKKRAKSQSYQAIRRERQEELMELAAEVDEALDRRRNRKARMLKKQVVKPVANRFNLPPKGYVRIREAAKKTGFSLSVIKIHLTNGRLPGQKFSRSTSSNQQVWYLSERTCNELKDRKKKGLGPVPTLYLRSEIAHGKGTKHV